MKRVLVTGASGFIGRHALAPLLARGFEVHAASRQPLAATAVHAHAVDLLDAEAAARLVREVRPTHLLHLAWYAEHGRFWTAEENFAWVGATQNLLAAFTRAGGTRAVLAGSCAEYAWGGEAPCDEARTPLVPATEYGVCKHATRQLAEAWCRRAGASCAWGRVFHLYGPGEHPERLVASVIRALLRGAPARCSSGRQLRDFLHVADVGDAFAALVDSAVGGAVNLASGTPVTIAEVARTIARRLGREDLLQLGALPDRAGDPMLLTARVERLAQEVGWRPAFDLERGLDDTIAAWRAAGAGA